MCRARLFFQRVGAEHGSAQLACEILVGMAPHPGSSDEKMRKGTRAMQRVSIVYGAFRGISIIHDY